MLFALTWLWGSRFWWTDCSAPLDVVVFAFRFLRNSLNLIILLVFLNELIVDDDLFIVSLGVIEVVIA